VRVTAKRVVFEISLFLSLSASRKKNFCDRYVTGNRKQQDPQKEDSLSLRGLVWWYLMLLLFLNE
jgi:hypothetical protein